jgi:2-polyprenyl-6-methoxyphenol hydroxylase-like FAD-dependent oxidoreductase
VGKDECSKLANRLEKDGWHEKYTAPLRRAKLAIRIGFCNLEPHLKKLVYGPKGRVVLVGDAAHPPVPYTGQGSQQGLEDAGVIAILLKSLCMDDNGQFDTANFAFAMTIYEKMRVPRTSAILEKAKSMGAMHQKRATDARFNCMKEEMIRRDVFFHMNLPVFFGGTRYDYRAEVSKVLEKEPAHNLPVLLPVIEEEERK